MSRRSRTAKIAMGDRVASKAGFLRSTGQSAGETPRRRGVVVEITKLGDNDLATIEWSEDGTGKALTCNLSKVTRRGIADE